jgi:hypothetical protein
MSAVAGEKPRRWENLWQEIFVGIEMPLKKTK